MKRARIFDDVSDTARWVAYYRALESERSDALFHDPFARSLAGERGHDIARALPTGPLGWAMAVRTQVYDELILGALRDGSVRAVLNLAAGLDARPYRMALSSQLSWIELDLPRIIADKERALQGERARCRVERIALDLADVEARRRAFARIGAEYGNVLVVAEGLIDYLDAGQVAGLAADLRTVPAFTGWLLAVAHPFTLQKQPRAWKRALREARAEMKFAPEAGLSFFESQGWYPREVRSMTEEARRLHRGGFSLGLFRVLSDLRPETRERFRRLVVYALLEPR